MIARFVLAVLILASPLLAASPTTKPSKDKPAAAPATQPAEPRSSFAKDVIAKFQAKQEKQNDLLKVAYIDLDRPMTEKPADFVLFADASLTLQDVVARLRKARDDANVRAVLVNLGETEFNLAQAQELRDAFAGLRKASKRVFVYADSYNTASYIAACGASDICLIDGGQIMIPGVGMQTMFAKGLLDKVGVKADYIQIGQYKGADEQYTRTAPSKEMAGELNKILDALFDQIVDAIAYGRNISRNDVRDMINGVMMEAGAAKQRKFIDHITDQDGLRDLMKKELGRDVDLLHAYGVQQHEPIDLSNPFALLTSLGSRSTATDASKPQIALIYAEGVIVDGETGDSLFGGSDSIGSENIRKAMRMAARDPNVKAIVLRIDSPGGSALASEVMWQAARRAGKDKPLIVSIGSMAASGGYYLASSGQYVFADSTAIVGSIGVVFGKFVLKDLFDKVGLTTTTFARGGNAGIFSSDAPFSDQQRRLVTQWMQQTYEQFVDRVMTTRKDKIKHIDDVAHGRIFVARQAKDLGMVDELGGMEKAIAHAAATAKLPADGFNVRVFPATRTLSDILSGNNPDAAMPFRPSVSIAPDSILRVLSPGTAKLVRQQIQILQMMQQRPIMLVSPYLIQVR